MIYQNILVLYSELSRVEYINLAKINNKIYTYKGASGQISMACDEYTYLACSGVINFLNRISVKYDLYEENDLNKNIIKNYSVIFLANAILTNDHTKQLIYDWLENLDNKIIISGNSDIDLSRLGIKASRKMFTGDCILEYNNIKIHCFKGYKPVFDDLIAEKKYDFDSNNFCKTFAVSNKNVLLINYPIYEFIGAIVQGHIDIEYIRKDLDLISSNYYIDNLIYTLRGTLIEFGLNKFFNITLNVWGEYDSILIIRHDVDESRDLKYYNYEIENNIPATYSILMDKNRDFWNKQINKPIFESSFHFTTIKGGKIRFILDRILRIKSPKADKKAITGDGLFKQLIKAEKSGIGIGILQRHFHYFYYPETIESQYYAYSKSKKLKGFGSLFRYKLYRYISYKELSKNIEVKHPNVSIPFWFPIKVFLPNLEKLEALRGWDIAHFLEPDKDIINSMFTVSNKFKFGVYTLGFHPAHSGNHFNNFVFAINKAKENDWLITTNYEVFKKINDWNLIKFRIQNDKIYIFNQGSEYMDNVTLQIYDKKINISSIAPNQTYEVDIK